MATLVTHMATATAGFTWMVVEWIMRGKPTVIGICLGVVAGQVAITPASAYVGPLGALWIGIAAGILCYWACTGLKRMFGYDDALDAFGVQSVALLAHCSPACSRSVNTAAPPACPKAILCSPSTRQSAANPLRKP
jgi:Ammonium Transporter Family